ncbi:hypothetical protein M3152_00945 [Sporosarcina luteola]|uniref:hypothetical protein n=1 Tax=Bacillales TaxID=1385 RepID=UPI002041E59F|nr:MULTISPECIES: hypothetical protein [Bacillales]MCM3636267.1 hypothetical protein [Sporosarcina luteola]
MRKNFLYFAISVFSVLLLVGCTDKQTEENHNQSDSYTEVREIAWNFVKEKGWAETAIENWQSAEVTKVVVGKNYDLLNQTYEGKEALSVSFKDKENSVIGTPLILIDSDTYKVIGYMLSE